MSSEELDPLDLNAQEAADADEADAGRLERQLAEEDLRWLMHDLRGRRFVWRLLSRTHVHNNPYAGAGRSEDTAFRCGQMNVGLMLLAELHQQCPGRYQQMVQEQQRNG